MDSEYQFESVRKIGKVGTYSYNVTIPKAIMQGLGWQSRHSFDQAIERTVRWYVDNEWWWRKIKSGEYLEYYKRWYGDRLDDAS